MLNPNRAVRLTEQANNDLIIGRQTNWEGRLGCEVGGIVGTYGGNGNDLWDGYWIYWKPREGTRSFHRTWLENV